MSSVSLKSLVRGASAGANALLSGDDVYEDARRKEIEYQSKIAQTIASTFANEQAGKLNQAKAAEVNAGIEMNKPENITRTALIGTGIPLDDAGDFHEYMNTGALGGKFRTPEDGVGPVATRPKWAGPGEALPGLTPSGTSPDYKDERYGPIANSIKAMVIAAQRGDKNSENVAKATGIYTNEDRIRQVIDGKLPAASFA